MGKQLEFKEQCSGRSGKEPVVNHVAYSHSHSFSQRQSPSAVLLAQLSGAHDQLVMEMENLDRLTHGPEPDPGELRVGRWRISQASLRRRSLAARIYDFLSNRLDGADLQQVKEVQAGDQDMMRKSARHVCAWTMQAIGGNWQGYCEASQEIRAHMQTHILLERQSLYPLLEKLAARGV
jgi:hypothetical protein